MRLPVLLAMSLLVYRALVANPTIASTAESRPLECQSPPMGVIRFAVLSDKRTADMYEWSGTTFIRRGREDIDKGFFLAFKAGSYHKWNFWDIADISRKVAGPGTLLSTPYSMDPEAKILAAGLETEGDDIHEPKELAFLEVATARVITIVDVGRSIVGLSWDPDSTAVVVITRAERYGNRSFRERLAAAIGHPIAYADIFLDVIGVDGAVHCSIAPVSSIPYGTGFVRWEEK